MVAGHVRPVKENIGLSYEDLADFRTNPENRESRHEGQDARNFWFSELRRISTQTDGRHVRTCNCPFECHLRAVAIRPEMARSAFDRQFLPDSAAPRAFGRFTSPRVRSPFESRRVIAFALRSIPARRERRRGTSPPASSSRGFDRSMPRNEGDSRPHAGRARWSGR